MYRIFYLLAVSFVLFFSFNSCKKTQTITKNKCDSVSKMPYTLSHFSNVYYGAKNYLIGGSENDSITNTLLIKDTLGFKHDTLHCLPQKLMNGFAFRLDNYVYYGGGYSTNWANNYTSKKDTLYSIIYTSSSRGFASADSGKIYKTLNSGASWNSGKVQTIAPLRSLYFYPGTNYGWVISDSSSSKIFKTSNNGDSWDSIGTVIGAAKIKSINFVSQDTGWAAGSEGKIFKSNNGGTAWDTVQRKSFDNLNSIFFLNRDFGWACGDNGRIVKTTNGGSTWDTLKVTARNLYSICFKDVSTGYAVGDKGTIAKTTNGGVNWNIVKVQSSQTLRSINMRGSDTTIACGDKGNLLYTNDGVKWERVYGITPNNLKAACFIPGTNKTSICGSNGFTSYANEGCFKYKTSKEVYRMYLLNSDSTWKACESLPNPVSEVFSSAGALTNSDAYVVGGRDSVGAYSNKILRYSSATGHWTYCTDLPSPRSYGGLAVVSDSLMLFLGGVNSTNATDTMYKISVNNPLTPDVLSISFGAKYPAGGIYGMGSYGVKFRKIGIFSGGMDDTLRFYKFNVRTNKTYDSLFVDTCAVLDPTFASITIKAGIYTVNWACPSMESPDSPPHILENSNTTLAENYTLTSSTEVIIVSPEFAICINNAINKQYTNEVIENNRTDKNFIDSIEILDDDFDLLGGINENFNSRDDDIYFTEHS